MNEYVLVFLCLNFGNVTQVYLLIWTVNCRDSFVLIYKVYSKNNCTFKMSIAHSGGTVGLGRLKLFRL